MLIDSLTSDAKNVATLVVLLLPGFVFISAFEAVNPAFARIRSAWEWTMWSLTLSLPIYAAFYGAYKLLGWPNHPLDAVFYLGLFAGALVAGYVSGRLSRFPKIYELRRWVGFSIAESPWVNVIGHPGSYVILHLTDGTVVYGYPTNFTDDPRQTREIFLTEARLLRRKDDTDQGSWADFPDTEGILIESSRIKFVQLVASTRSSSSEPS